MTYNLVSKCLYTKCERESVKIVQEYTDQTRLYKSIQIKQDCTRVYKNVQESTDETRMYNSLCTKVSRIY